MTHTLTLADNAKALYPAASLDISVTDGADDNRGRRLSDRRRGVTAVSAITETYLILIILLILSHSGYWALLLPSWLAFVAFLSGASDSAGDEQGIAGAQGGVL